MEQQQQQQQPQWTAYSESNANRQARYDSHNMTTPQQAQRDPNVPQQQIKEQFASPTAPSRTT